MEPYIGRVESVDKLDEVTSAGRGSLLVGSNRLRAVEVVLDRDDGQSGPLGRVLVSETILLISIPSYHG